MSELILLGVLVALNNCTNDFVLVITMMTHLSQPRWRVKCCPILLLESTAFSALLAASLVSVRAVEVTSFAL